MSKNCLNCIVHNRLGLKGKDSEGFVAMETNDLETKGSIQERMVVYASYADGRDSFVYARVCLVYDDGDKDLMFGYPPGTVEIEPEDMVGMSETEALYYWYESVQYEKRA